jgi:hypothetical protein
MVWDLFITHAWRYHEDWVRLSELLDAEPGLSWRNFSVPWHDPAMDPNTEVGGRFVRDWLETQIMPVVGVIMLASVFERGSAKRWISLEIEVARRHNKPIVALPAHGHTKVAPEVEALADAAAPWDARAIIATVDRLRKENAAHSSTET